MSYINIPEDVVEYRMDELISRGDFIGAALEANSDKLVISTKVSANLEYYENSIRYDVRLNTKDNHSFDIAVKIPHKHLHNTDHEGASYLIENILNMIKDRFYIIRKD